MKTWNTFVEVRKRLENQYVDIAFDENTGLSLDELRIKTDKYIMENRDQSKILIKANVYFTSLSNEEQNQFIRANKHL